MYIWLLKLRPLSWKTQQTAFIPHRQGAEAVCMIERCMAREWNMPVYIAQLDLKKAFDRISHDSIAENVLSQKPLSSIGGCTLQLVVLPFSGSPFGDT